MQLDTVATQSLAQPEEIPRLSRSTYFGDVSETIGRNKDSLGTRDPKRTDRAQ